MVRSSPVAIFRLQEAWGPPLSKSRTVGSGWLGVITGIASGLKSVGEREGMADVQQVWLTRTIADVLGPG